MKYPHYENSTAETAQCTTSLCNTYESNFEPGEFLEGREISSFLGQIQYSTNLTCYECSELDTDETGSCRTVTSK